MARKSATRASKSRTRTETGAGRGSPTRSAGKAAKTRAPARPAGKKKAAAKPAAKKPAARGASEGTRKSAPSRQDAIHRLMKRGGPRPALLPEVPAGEIINAEAEDLNEALARFEENVRNVDEDDVEYAAKKGPRKLEELARNVPQPLRELWAEVRLMVSCVRDYWTGAYREIPWKSIAAMAGAIVYFVTPIDAIPDFIPLVGYVDDAAVLALTLRWVHGDLETYRKWKESRSEASEPAAPSSPAGGEDA